MKISTLKSVAIALVSGVFAWFSGAAFAESVTIPASSAIDLSSATLSNCSLESDTTVVGSTRPNSTVTLALTNTTAGDYLVSFKSGISGTATITVEVTGGDYSVSRNYDIPNTGAWTPATQHYLILPALPAGEFTLVLTCLTNTNVNNYNGNYGAFTITAPGDVCFVPPVEEGTILIEDAANAGKISHTGGYSVDSGNSNESKAIGSTKNDTVVSFKLYLDENAQYGFSYKTGASGCAATAAWTLVNDEGTSVWSETDTIENNGGWHCSEAHSHDLGTLAAGIYTLSFATTITSGSYAGNYGYFAFTKESLVRYTLTVPAVEHATVTVSGASATENEGVYSAASNVTVTVTYTAEKGYTITANGEQTFANIAGDISAVAPTVLVSPLYTSGYIETTDDYYAIAPADNTTGEVIVNAGGSLEVAGALYMVRGSNGGGTGSAAYLTVNDGAVTVGNGFFTGWGAGGVATFIQNGGAFSVTGAYEPAYGGSTTNYTTIAGGTFTTSGNLNLCNYGGAYVAVTISGGEVNIGGEVRYFNRADECKAIVNLTGGTLATKRLYTNNGSVAGSGEFTLAGGTLKATQAQSAFIENTDVITVRLASGTIDTQSYAVTIPANISGDSMAFTKAGSGSLTFTGTLPSSGTITVAKGAGAVTLPGDLSTGWAGAETYASYDSESGTTTFEYYQGSFTLTVPAIANATVAVTADGVEVEGTDGVYTVSRGATVVVTYSAADGFAISGTASVTLENVTADYSLEYLAKETFATVSGATAYTIASGEKLVYSGRAVSGTMDTALGIVIEAGGKLVIDLSSMAEPVCDGTRGNDGAYAIPAITLPEGAAFTSVISFIPKAGTHVKTLVAADGYGFATILEGDAPKCGLVIILR